MKTIVVIPTYEEKENVEELSAAILNADTKLEILFCDDNSPDGTGEILDELSAANPRIHVLHRPKKEGLGKAYIAGFCRAIELGAEKIVQMDADFSHDPEDLPRLIGSEADLTIGSRYIKGGATIGWPLKRKIISRLGGFLVRAVTGMNVKDPTGGFKCWKVSVLKAIDFKSVASFGYSFQLEMNHRSWLNAFNIIEVPISFAERKRGYSKITPGIAFESLKIVFSIWKKAHFRRLPHKREL